MSRPQSLLLVLLLGGLASSCLRQEEPGLARRVILITCDTLRADRLGIYGYPRDVSPRLDEFARRSVVFDQAYSPTAITNPSLSALFTGRLPDEIGVSANNQTLLPPEATTLAEVLQRAGIPTAAVVSNWVLRRRQGDVGVQQGFTYYDDRMETGEANRDGVFERIAADTTQAAIQWLEARKDDRFFLWVHYQDPHGPYTPPAGFVSDLDRPLGSEPPLEVGTTQLGRAELPAYQVLGDERRPEYYRIRYDAEIRYFDSELGRLMDALRSKGLMDDSLIVFTADHGESLGEHGWWFTHGHHVFREAVHVPMIVRFPDGAIRPDVQYVNGVARVERLVSHQDLWPTILEALGVTAPPSRGRSMFQRFLSPDHVVLQELRAPGSSERWLGVTTERYRLLVSPVGPLLFDLQADPLENVNLARSDPDRVQELMELQRSELERVPAFHLRGVKDVLDAAGIDAMSKLGYSGQEEDDETD